MATAEARKADYEVGRVENRLRQEAQYWSTQMESAQVRYSKAQQNLIQLQQQHSLMQKAYKLGSIASTNCCYIHNNWSKRVTVSIKPKLIMPRATDYYYSIHINCGHYTTNMSMMAMSMKVKQ